MTDLIERIDGWQYDVPADIKLHALLIDCRAEIQRLLTANESLKGLCDEYQAQIKAQGEYVPMTDDDFDLATGYKTSVDCRVITHNQADVMLAEYREVEAAFINRAGLRVKEKE